MLSFFFYIGLFSLKTIKTLFPVKCHKLCHLYGTSLFFILFFYKAVKEKEEPKAAGTPIFLCHAADNQTQIKPEASVSLVNLKILCGSFGFS